MWRVLDEEQREDAFTRISELRLIEMAGRRAPPAG
jgi:hypothetical protein